MGCLIGYRRRDTQTLTCIGQWLTQQGTDVLMNEIFRSLANAVTLMHCAHDWRRRGNAAFQFDTAGISNKPNTQVPMLRISKRQHALFAQSVPAVAG